MKKLLILVLVGLLLALSIFIVINGFEVGKIEILGINGIQLRNSELDLKIQEAAKLSEKDYVQAVSTVKSNTRRLTEVKNTYEDMVLISSESDVQIANQIEKYEMETLWVKLGNHASSEGAVMKMEVLTGSNLATNTYNLRFTVNGSYIAITEFISNIENDSQLGFRIEEFKLMPTGSTNELQATFTCENIGIKEISQSTINNQENNESNDVTNVNNTNSTVND